MKVTVNVPVGVTDVYFAGSDGKTYQMHLGQMGLNTNTLVLDPGNLQLNDIEHPNLAEIRQKILEIEGKNEVSVNRLENVKRDPDGLPNVEQLRKLL